MELKGKAFFYLLFFSRLIFQLYQTKTWENKNECQFFVDHNRMKTNESTI